MQPPASKDIAERPPSARRPRRWRRAFLVALLSLAALYWVSANLLLSTATGRRLLEPRGDRVHLSWSGAHSVFPGIVHFRDLEVGGETVEGRRWRFDVERGRLWVDPTALARRLVALRWVTVEGVSCAIDSDASDAAGAGHAVGQRSSVTSSVFEDAAEPRELTPASPRRPTSSRRPWRVAISGARLERVSGCAFAGYRFAGTGSIEGSWSIETRRGPIEIGPIRLRFEAGAELFRDQQRVANLARLEGSFDAFTVTRDRGPRTAAPAVPTPPAKEALVPRAPSVEVDRSAWVSQLTGSLDLEAETTSLAWLDAYLSRADWLQLEGSGRLALRLEVERGELRPGTRMALDGDAITLRYLDYRARGRARLNGELSAGRPHLDARFEEFELVRGEGQPAYLRGDRLAVAISPRDASLVRLPELDVTVELPWSEVPDLRAYNVYLPADEVAIVGGRGRVRARFELATVESTGNGRVDLQSDRFELRAGDLELGGRLQLTALLGAGEIASRSFGLAGSTLELSGVTVRRQGEVLAEDWHGELGFVGGRLRLGPPFAGDAEMSLALADAGPLLAYFAERRPKLSMIGRMLRVRDITGHARLELDRGAVLFDSFELQGERLQLEGRLCLGAGKNRGALYARSLGIGMAAEFVDRDRHWTVIRPRHWFEKRRAEVRCFEIEER